MDKGPGLLSVPPDRGQPPTVLSLLHRRLRGAHDQLFAVHRLDRDTSGVMVVARTRRALGDLVGQLRERKFTRIYLALVRGTPPPCGTLTGALVDQERDIRVKAVDESEGKVAITHFRVVEQAGGMALVALKLETGRRNQIRVQLAELGHPLVGEHQYADADDSGLPRQALHSHRLTVFHPASRRPLTGLSPLPPDLLAVWRRAGGRHGRVLREDLAIPGPDAPTFKLRGRRQVDTETAEDGERPPPPPPRAPPRAPSRRRR